MRLISWFKSLYEKDKSINTNFESISVFKTESPGKIIETKIRPVKIPTIVDIVDRLSSIFYELNSLKNDMVSKSWFQVQYEDSTVDVLNRLDSIERALNNINLKLSNFTKSISDFKKPESELLEPPLSVSERIYNIIRIKKHVRFKDIVNLLPFSDPTISKYLKILTNSKKIKRVKTGKAVFYSLP